LLILFLLFKDLEHFKTTINLLEDFYNYGYFKEDIQKYINNINDIKNFINYINKICVKILISILFGIFYINFFKYPSSTILSNGKKIKFEDNIKILNFNTEDPTILTVGEKNFFPILNYLLRNSNNISNKLDELLEGQEGIKDLIDDLEEKIDKNKKSGPLLISQQTQTITQVSVSTQTNIQIPPLRSAVAPVTTSTSLQSTIININGEEAGNITTNTTTSIDVQTQTDNNLNNSLSNQVFQPQGIGRNLLVSAIIIGASTISSSIIEGLLYYFTNN
jgi:hypothetical protein